MAASEVHDLAYYAKCMMGGILSCGITHTGITPLDQVKCRMQVNLNSYEFSQCVNLLGWCVQGNGRRI
jgi:hypothetical protein